MPICGIGITIINTIGSVNPPSSVNAGDRDVYLHELLDLALWKWSGRTFMTIVLLLNDVNVGPYFDYNS